MAVYQFVENLMNDRELVVYGDGSSITKGFRKTRIHPLNAGEHNSSSGLLSNSSGRMTTRDSKENNLGIGNSEYSSITGDHSSTIMSPGACYFRSQKLQKLLQFAERR